MIKTATVVNGPGVWVGKSGRVLFMDADWVVVEIEASDDCGKGTFEVRFPIGFVNVVTELALA